LSAADVDEVGREIRLALLEADVNVRVVKRFVARLKERATGAEVTQSLTPGQQIIKIVHEVLAETLGGATGKLATASKPPTIVLLAGLQGSGKTTAAAKLARLLGHQGRRPLLVGADLQRPAAVEQLRVLGDRVGVPVISDGASPLAAARAGIAEAERLGRNVVIVDTAGRLQVDQELMGELAELREAIAAHEALLVVDAMTGQEAVNVAETFAEALALTGVVLTKLDGDARGGAALSVKEVTGLPILFAGTGETLDDFEVFHPDRMASRILGMGDVMTLIEKAETAFDAEQAAKTQAKLRKGQFTLDDFLDQMRQVRKMGPIQNLVGMMPGLPKEMRQAQIDEGELARMEAIISSMTLEERHDPSVINGSRRARIATGSGTSTQQVNALLKQFKTINQLMRTMSKTAGKAGKRGRGGRRGPPDMTELQGLSFPGMPGLP
jgi:signal recognition particle subunit SRP54